MSRIAMKTTCSWFAVGTLRIVDMKIAKRWFCVPWIVVLALKNVKPMRSADAMFSASFAIRYVGSRQWNSASRRRRVMSW